MPACPRFWLTARHSSGNVGGVWMRWQAAIAARVPPRRKPPGAYFGPQTRSSIAVSEATWTLITLPSALRVKTSTTSAVSPATLF
jgi:hypothetical protein